MNAKEFKNEVSPAGDSWPVYVLEQPQDDEDHGVVRRVGRILFCACGDHGETALVLEAEGPPVDIYFADGHGSL